MPRGRGFHPTIAQLQAFDEKVLRYIAFCEKPLTVRHLTTLINATGDRVRASCKRLIRQKKVVAVRVPHQGGAMAYCLVDKAPETSTTFYWRRKS